MAESPKRPKRPRDVIGNAVRVMEVATGQREEEAKPEEPKNEAAAAMGKKGDLARAKALTPKQRREIAKAAAKSRWKTSADAED
jgi:hypothetical protein